ncbi:hypothetical protein DVH05_005819 [Phytophthora capsici]|nr:hypothetical protein DVH05_005819 [Phytophthora capsici]
MLAATVTTAINGKAWVPAINSDNRPARLPNKKELETWVPVDKDMEVIATNNGMDPSRLEQWMNELGDAETPLDNEDEVNIGTDVPKDRVMIMRLLHVYRKLSSSTSACPPTTALDLHHHIDAGKEALIMLKRRRQAQTEDKIIDQLAYLLII